MKLSFEGSEDKKNLVTEDPKDPDYIDDQYLASLDERGQLLKDLMISWRSMFIVLNTRSKNRVQSGKSLVKFTPGEGQGRVLMRLGANDGITQAVLAHELDITPQTLGIHLHKLEAQGLVKRAKSEQDGRAMLVYLTVKGKRALYALEEEEKYSGSMFEIFDTQELVQFKEFVERLDKRLREEINASSGVDALLKKVE